MAFCMTNVNVISDREENNHHWVQDNHIESSETGTYQPVFYSDLKPWASLSVGAIVACDTLVTTM